MTTEQNEQIESGSGRYRHILERDTQLMEAFAARMGKLEMESGSTRSDIKSLFSGLEKISGQLDNMLTRSRPNTLALFIAGITFAGFVITVGVLAFAPVYREGDAASTERHLNRQDIKYLAETKVSKDDFQIYRSEVNERFYRNEAYERETALKAARLEGVIYTRHAGGTKE